jgi:hypothetical protein
LASTYVKLNYQAVADVCLNGEGMQALLDDIAQEVAGKSGVGAEVQDHGQATKYGTTRHVKRVVDTRENALYRESKTGALARALGSVKR